MTIKYFEEIDCSKLENYYSKEIEIDSKPVDVDLNFESESINENEIKKLNLCLDNLKSIIDNSWKWIIQDYKNGEDVNEYISFHLDDFFEDNPEEILKGTDPKLNNKDRFLQTLRINRVGIYQSSENYLIIDWMTNPELSNYILVVNVNDKFELEYITVES